MNELELSLPFAVLFEALKHNYDTYLNNVWTTLGLLLLCIGWFFTSEKMRHLKNKTRNLLLKVLIFTLVVHIGVLHHYFNQSNEILDLIGLDRGEEFIQNVEYFRIKGYYIVLSLSLAGSLYFVLGWVLLNLNKE